MLLFFQYSDEQWLRFFKLVGKEEILKDSQFSSLKSRNENIDLLYHMLSEELTKQDTNYWLKSLKQSDIPAAKVNFPEEIFEDEHLQETNFFRETQHPSEGKLLYPKFPVEFKNTDNGETLHAPNLGENTKEILVGLGYSDFEIESLASKNIIKI